MKRILYFFYFLILVGNKFSFGQIKNNEPANNFSFKWNHPYHQTLVMKMGMAVPDKKGGTTIYSDFDRALQLIKETDHLTLNVPKIIYLVGWQYNGHDDKYPAFFEVNEKLKRPGDSNARESLLWLMKEARKYNTTISLHINMTDAYDDSPLWEEYVANDLISKNADGSLLVIGNYNNRKAYQINYKNEWNKGYAQKRIDKLIELLPSLKEAGTVHIDAWIARESKGHYESTVTEAEYQKKICKYWIEKGIEPTSEWVMDYMTGMIPFYWHFNHRTQNDYMDFPASVVTGSHMNPDLRYSDFGLEFLFGTSMYGENLFPNAFNKIADNDWQVRFGRDFYLNFLQYYYLNSLQRLKVEGEKNNRVAFFSGNVKGSLADSTVFENNRRLRSGNTVCFPALWRKDNSLAAYSTEDRQMEYQLPDSWKNVSRADVFLVQKNGLVKRNAVKVINNQITVAIKKDTPLLILPSNDVPQIKKKKN